MTRALRTIEEIFGEPLPPLMDRQKHQLDETLKAMLETCFRGPYQNVVKGARNRAIARLVLVEGMTLKQAGQEFNLTAGRIGQIRLKALRLLRHPTRSRPLRKIFSQDYCEE